MNVLLHKDMKQLFDIFKKKGRVDNNSHSLSTRCVAYEIEILPESVVVLGFMYFLER